MTRVLATSISLALIAGLFIALPAAAWDKEDWDPQASIVTCGDPRVQATFDNSTAFPTLFKLVYKNGNKASDVKRKVVKKYVPAWTVKRTAWRWVLGQGSKLRITVWNPDTRLWQPILIERIYAGPAWGSTPECQKPVKLAR